MTADCTGSLCILAPVTEAVDRDRYKWTALPIATLAVLLATLDGSEVAAAAKELRAPLEIVREVAANGKLPVVMFSAGGIANPSDAALMMRLGAEGVFVGSGIFKAEDPERMAAAVVEATTHFEDAARIAAASRDLGAPMPGTEISALEAEGGLLQNRGW